MIFQVRFTKEFTLLVEADSLAAARGAASSASDAEIEAMDGGAEWDSQDVWTAPDWKQDHTPPTVVRRGVFAHRDDEVKP